MNTKELNDDHRLPNRDGFRDSSGGRGRRGGRGRSSNRGGRGRGRGRVGSGRGWERGDGGRPRDGDGGGGGGGRAGRGHHHGNSNNTNNPGPIRSSETRGTATTTDAVLHDHDLNHGSNQQQLGSGRCQLSGRGFDDPFGRAGRDGRGRNGRGPGRFMGGRGRRPSSRTTTDGTDTEYQISNGAPITADATALSRELSAQSRGKNGMPDATESGHDEQVEICTGYSHLQRTKTKPPAPKSTSASRACPDNHNVDEEMVSKVGGNSNNGNHPDTTSASAMPDMDGSAPLSVSSYAIPGVVMENNSEPNTFTMTQIQRPHESGSSDSIDGVSSSQRRNNQQKNIKKKKNDIKNRRSSHKVSDPNASAQPELYKPNGDGEATTSDSNKENGKSKRSRKKHLLEKPYEPHWTLEMCYKRYATTTAPIDPDTLGTPQAPVVRGTLRVLHRGSDSSSFVRDDRGYVSKDVYIVDAQHRNRALSGDTVFVELIPFVEIKNDAKHDKTSDHDRCCNDDSGPSRDGELETSDHDQMASAGTIQNNTSNNGYVKDGIISENRIERNENQNDITWQDDPVQMDLWNPVVPIKRLLPKSASDWENEAPEPQYQGRVVGIVPPKPVASEVLDIPHPGSSNDIGKGNARSEHPIPTRRIVGSIEKWHNGIILMTPSNRSLPQFKCPDIVETLLLGTNEKVNKTQKPANRKKGVEKEHVIYQAEYVFGSWAEHFKWPPCTRVSRLGVSAVLEDEIQALLTEYHVDHGEFSSTVLSDVDAAVASGKAISDEGREMEWKPTPEMYVGRRDLRHERIFTIDPTTAKDLDDALHIKRLPDGKTVEVGVHIADVSYFVRPGTAVDQEALRRATTTYLVDRTIPMLPRPLCEIACSLNESVERLAFSCIWKMNLDGTMRAGEKDDVWYGRTVIKSCARLDYATAQNIIDDKIALESTNSNDGDEALWPKSRRPTGGHSTAEIASDIRLMHCVAAARRQLRFNNGALGLHGIKLTFQLDEDGQTPLLVAPYPIRDSNRLVEEFMLLANYLVAERLITHAGGLALLRLHPEPILEGLEKVAAVAKAGYNFDVDISSSKSLHNSLVQLGHECNDPLVLQCVTQLLMTPMQAAEYFAAGLVKEELWRHFALNIPYYTHFTSPIRRYADVMVHRLLQATIDGPGAVQAFPQDAKTVGIICDQCNTMRMEAKHAQERCDRVYLSLFLKSHSMQHEMGVVLSVGISMFTVFVSRLGVDAKLFLDDHKDVLTFASEQQKDGTRRILLQQKPKDQTMPRWETLSIEVFTKIQVSVLCKLKPPIDVKLRLEGPWPG